MKVLFFNYEYPPLGGGAANATANILREYSRLDDLNVDLITSSIDEAYHLEKIGENIRVHRLPIGKNKSNLHFQSQKDLLLYSWKAFWFSQKLCRKNNYDLTHSFFTVPCGFISMMLKWQFKIPYVVSLRGSDVPGYSDRFPLIYAFLKPLFSLIWKQSFAVISNSEGLKELALKTNSKQKIGVIYNGIDTDKFKPLQNQSSALNSKAELYLEKFIITPGASRITDRKGLNYLIDAVAMMQEKYPQVHLRIMGEGNARLRLEKQVEELRLSARVEFLGRIPREETSGYYQEADVFVLPSLNEGMSNAMLEALSSGLPILATDAGGTKELVTDGENGYIIRMKDATHLAEKLGHLIENPELRRLMGEASRARALEMSWEKVAGEYYNLYKVCSKKI